jgi:pimeloyl-ACP methyl ester carboxylesterase
MRHILLAVLCVPLLGCQPTSIEVRAVGTPITADDGRTLMAFKLVDHAHEHTKPRALILYIQGSEPRSVADHVAFLAGFCALDAPVIAVERRGVRPDAPADLDAFHAGSTKERRVADHLAALDWGLKEVPADLPVIVLGASEGADVAAAVAARSPRITAVILLAGGGGWTQEQEFRHFLHAQGRLFDLTSDADLDARVREIKDHPDALTLWAGHPYRRWSSFMFSRPGDDLLKFTGPILAVQGDADDSVPIESARALKDMFDHAGRTNLTLAEIPGADHKFSDPKTGQNKRPLVEVAVVEWLNRHGLLSQNEKTVYITRVHKAHPDLFPQKPPSGGSPAAASH